MKIPMSLGSQRKVTTISLGIDSAPHAWTEPGLSEPLNVNAESWFPALPVNGNARSNKNPFILLWYRPKAKDERCNGAESPDPLNAGSFVQRFREVQCQQNVRMQELIQKQLAFHQSIRKPN